MGRRLKATVAMVVRGITLNTKNVDPCAMVRPALRRKRSRPRNTRKQFQPVALRLHVVLGQFPKDSML